MLSVHTSPLDAPGGGDAGGMNVYIVETARRLADAGVEVEIFTRATSSEQPPEYPLCPGVSVRHVTAGPFEGLAKNDLPAQLCAVTAGVMRAEARHEPGWYDLIHSHYWLSGQVGWLARERWGVPLVHSAHTLAKVKNALLADGDEPEPRARVIGEEQVVAEADRLIASTVDEAGQLVELYGADPRKVRTIAPGVDLDTFVPGDALAARRRLGLRADALTLLFVGRIQPLKAPDVLLRAAAIASADPALAGRLQVVILGAPSGSGLEQPQRLEQLRDELGLGGVVEFRPPAPRSVVADYYRAADLTVVPSYNESFGLVALESQACGTPVVAAAVGGLPTAVADDVSGVLVDGHDPDQWAKVLLEVLRSSDVLARLATGARAHAERFSWERTADGLLVAYREAILELRSNSAANQEVVIRS
ncbi:D-inositol-3-phosphate glycosyltransferase [uncultured Jatrophihabitans sp.]|uniref:D-inositol-3-phosphate glycosyltransferase n=1 Tax=uncultured Jatrophihabitans sp. TaxID=1610747 RepID=UPI0035CB85BA